MQKYIKIHTADKVAVALCPLTAGTEVTIENQTLLFWKTFLRVTSFP